MLTLGRWPRMAMGLVPGVASSRSFWSMDWTSRVSPSAVTVTSSVVEIFCGVCGLFEGWGVAGVAGCGLLRGHVACRRQREPGGTPGYHGSLLSQPQGPGDIVRIRAIGKDGLSEELRSQGCRQDSDHRHDDNQLHERKSDGTGQLIAIADAGAPATVHGAARGAVSDG